MLRSGAEVQAERLATLRELAGDEAADAAWAKGWDLADPLDEARRALESLSV